MTITRRFRLPTPIRTRRVLLPIAAAMALVGAAPVVAYAEPIAAQDMRDAAERADRSTKSFYEARAFQPLWVKDGRVTPAGAALLELVRSAKVDSVKTGPLKAKVLAKALARAESGASGDLAKAELALSRSFTAYVRALRAAPRAQMQYETPALEPVVPTHRAALEAAAAATSLSDYVRRMGWMHPLYAEMRNALLARTQADNAEDGQIEALLRLNLERIRAIPAYSVGRHVLVDAANARLVMYDNGKVVRTMRVVVGTAENQTPMMAGFLRYAQVNPYWNIPTDLVQKRIAPHVLSKGLGYMKASGYQVLDSWDENAKVIDPATIDWTAVAAGQREVRVRQLPGRDNFMGKVKFMFPNPQGIYLHDTPDRHLLVKDERQFSSGCVRLEDAPGLGKWLFGKPLPKKTKKIEQRIDLPELVPVYITYLTASVTPGGAVAVSHDVYGRDTVRLAKFVKQSGNGR